MNHKSNMMGCYANPALTCFKENGDCTRCHVFTDEPITTHRGGGPSKMLWVDILLPVD